MQTDDSKGILTSTKCKKCDTYKQEIKRLQNEVHYWQSKYFKKEEKPLGLHVLNNATKVKTYTGLPSKQVFDGLFASFGHKVKKIRQWKGLPMVVRPNIS